jgi:hypothetical protein
VGRFACEFQFGFTAGGSGMAEGAGVGEVLSLSLGVVTFTGLAGSEVGSK